jgi:hypothetical protein
MPLYSTASTGSGNVVIDVTAAGNLGTTETVTLGDTPVARSGTLDQSTCAFTVNGLAEGRWGYLILTQDGTGGREITVNDGGGAVAVAVDETAGATTVLLLVAEDASNLTVAALGGAAAADLAAHLADATAAHAASAVSFSPTGTIAGTDVQTAVAEVATDAAALVTAHTGDATDAHAASAIGFTPVGAIAATDVQAAIAELEDEHDDRLDTIEAALGGGSEVLVPRSIASPPMRAGRSYSTNFATSAQTALTFDATGLTFTTDASDSSRTAVRLTTLGTPGTMFLKSGAGWFRNMDVRMRYRNESSIHSSSEVRAYVRYLDASNSYFGIKSYGGANEVGAYKDVAGSESGVSGASSSGGGGVDTDVTSNTPRILRMRIIENVLFLKSWKESSTEPDWQIVKAIDPSAYWHEQGGAGFQILNYDVHIYVTEFTVTELIPASDNMLLNGDLSIEDWSTGIPIFWTANSGVNRVADTEVVADRYGENRSALHFEATADGGAQWTCRIHSTMHSYNSSTAWRRNQPAVASGFPPAIEISLWTKATSVSFNTPGADFLGASFVGKHYNEANTDLSLGQPDYYAGFGPDGELGGSGATGGIGTWDWLQQRIRMPIHDFQECAYIDLAFGLHDADSRGELWIQDIEIRPVL